MKTDTEIQARIDRVQKVDPTFPGSMIEIPGFPFMYFDSLQRNVSIGTAQMMRFSFRREAWLLEVLYSKGLERGFALLTFARLIVPVISVIMAFTISWWFLLGIFYFAWGARFPNRMYDRAILNAAMMSEPAFRLLFYGSQVSIHFGGREYEWQKLNGK